MKKMVNEIILNYLRQTAGKFKIRDIKEKVLSSGYSEMDFDEAFEVFKSMQPAGDFDDKNKEDIEDLNNAGRTGKRLRWTNISSLCGILFLVILVLRLIFNFSFLEIDAFAFFIDILILALLILFFYGFALIGKRSSNLLRVMAWIYIIMIFLFLVFRIVSFASPDLISSALMPDISFNDIEEGISGLIAAFVLFFIILGVLFLVNVVLGILFGVGLIKSRLKFSKAAGILGIIGFSTLILGIGALLLLAEYVFLIIILIREEG